MFYTIKLLGNTIITMNWFEFLYVCMKQTKVHKADTKRENNIENLNVCITNDRLTEGSMNYSESCNSILSELSTIDEEE
jgi:hypothetical protein